MTDGEYNKQYYGGDSATQALAICKQMRDQGIKVFTIGFGFSSNVNPPNSNILSTIVSGVG